MWYARLLGSEQDKHPCSRGQVDTEPDRPTLTPYPLYNNVPMANNCTLSMISSNGHDSNLTLEVLPLILHTLKDRLLPTLYLQMDNCGRENKNKYFLGFFTLRVAKVVFKKVNTNDMKITEH